MLRTSAPLIGALGVTRKPVQYFEPKQMRAFLRRARTVGRDGAEICGLLVDTKAYLRLVEIRNVSRSPGSFEFSKADVRRTVKAAVTLGFEVVGTFHSHPAHIAEPGQGDIVGAVDDSLLCILDCSNSDFALWHVRSGKARKIRSSLWAGPTKGSHPKSPRKRRDEEPQVAN